MTWEKMQIEEICLRVTDGAHHSPPSVEDGFPMASSKDMRENDFDLSNVRMISESDYNKLVNGNCKPNIGDVLIIKDGNSYLKYVFAVKEEREIVLLSSIAILRPDQEKINPFFFQHLLRSPDIKKEMENYVSGAAIPRIVLKDFKSMWLPVPPLTTQRRIASILSAYDDLIENNLKRIKLLEEAAQNIYQEWFVKMRFPGHEKVEWYTDVEGRRLPEGWKYETFYDMVDIMSGGTPKTREPSYWNGEIPFFTPKDASATSQWYIYTTEKTITEEGLSKCNSKLYPPDTIFITARGTVGKVRLAMRPMAMNQSCYALKMKDGSSQYYLLGTLNEAVSHLKKTAVGGVFDTIIVDTFKQIPFLNPDHGTTQRFHNLIAPVIKQTATLSKEIITSKEARDILLPRLMNQTITV
jgi:type I restriction enzyme S subunit